MAATLCRRIETLVFLLSAPVVVQGLHGLAGDFSSALDLPVTDDATDAAPLDVANISKELMENISQELGENISVGNLTKQTKDKPSPKKYKNDEMVVQWNSSNVEEGSEIEFFWDHSCTAGNWTGVCTFKKGDKHNPPGVHVHTNKMFDSDAHVTLTAWIRVLGIVTKRNVQCPACDGKCVMNLPLSGAAIMTTPPCPLEDTFDLIMPDMDFSKIPSFVRGYAATTVAIARGGEDGYAFKATLDTWV